MHGSRDDEYEYEADEVEIIANLRVEQRIAGAVPFSKNYKQISITFCPEDGCLEANVIPRSIRIPMIGKSANVYVHCSRMREGKITFRDINRSLTLMVSDVRPDLLQEFQRSVKDAILFKTKGIKPHPRSPIGGKRRPLSEISPSAKRHKGAFDDGDEDDDDDEDSVVKLSEEQVKVVQMAVNGESLFITGGAGTGKSLVIREIIRRLPKAGTFITASTGIAACNINGTTIHQFSGLGRGDSSAESIAKSIDKRDSGHRWRMAKTLIVDEISMVCGHTFDKLNSLAKLLRKSKKPFGGIQLILCGDFLQLPPVSIDGSAPLCFESKSWQECVTQTIQLKKVFRQADSSFAGMLEQIRWGKCSDEALAKLKSRKVSGGGRPSDGGIVATKLMTHKKDVDQINAVELSKLTSEAKLFTSRDEGSTDMISMLKVNCTAQREVVLKQGAQVILLKTISAKEGLVNGARGVVEAFAKATGLPIVRFDNGAQITVNRETWSMNMGDGRSASRSQIPLNLAWAISIHKSQGMSLSRVQVSLSKVFECGQAYVALSRARTLEGLEVLDIRGDCIRANPKVVQFYRAASPILSHTPSTHALG